MSIHSQAFDIPQFIVRSGRFRIRVLSLAITGCIGVFAPTLNASVITDVGAAGGSGSVGAAGGNGGSSNAAVASTDTSNTAAATAGAGGQGGASVLPLVPGGQGGNGGGAAAHIDSTNTLIESTEVSGAASAIGGAGGNGGAGAIRGNGGDGGSASARLATISSIEEPSGYGGSSTALGGSGGVGTVGGAGGAADASLLVTHGNNGGSGGVSQASGGTGGDGVLRGGNGGAARADNDLRVGGMPADDYSTAIATAGSGGSAGTGINGNGGDASANAYGAHSARDLGIEVQATAQGGNSGSGGSPGAGAGRGGNAVAISNGTSSWQGMSATSTALAGNGLASGGSALATAQQDSAVSGSATAIARGGSGLTAGSALATALGNSGVAANYGTAIASQSGSFGREVQVISALSMAPDVGPSTIYTQASAGDTRALQASVPAPSGTPTLLARGSIAAVQADVDTALAKSSSVANAFAGNQVWGLGEVHAGSISQSEQSFSYSFDVSEYVDRGILWLGLFDANFSADSFVIRGDGVTLFDAAGPFSLVDDRLIDLGRWFDLIGSDGLFNLDFDFVNVSGDIAFAFANIGGNTNAVPEPSTLFLLVPGLVLLLVRSRRAA